MCYYAANRLAKVVWKHLQTDASELYTFIQAFGFGSYQEYVELLRLHVDSQNRIEGGRDYDETVCSWLRQRLPPAGSSANASQGVMRYQVAAHMQNEKKAGMNTVLILCSTSSRVLNS